MIVTLHLDAENVEQLREMKRESGIPISRLVDKALKKFLLECRVSKDGESGSRRRMIEPENSVTGKGEKR